MLVIIGVGIACFFLGTRLNYGKIKIDKFIIGFGSILIAIEVGGFMLAPKIGGYFPQVYVPQETERLRPMVVFPPAGQKLERLFLLEQGLVQGGDTLSYGLYNLDKGRAPNLDANAVPVKIIEDRADDDGYVIRSKPRFTNRAHYLLGMPDNKNQYEFHIPPGTHKTIIG